jgi:hypothetical protein
MNNISRILFFISIFAFKANGQDVSKLLLGLGHGGGIPLGDVSERFGGQFESSIGLYKHYYKSNTMLGIDISLIYGNKVKENVLAGLQVDGKPLLGLNGSPSRLNLRQRGSTGFLTYAKLMSTKGEDYKGGIKWLVGIGLMEHHIRIVDDSRNNAYFSGDYLKGYDRYTFGPALKQAIGYQHISQSFNFSYSIMLEFEEGFTKSIRSVNFDTMLADESRRLDVFINLKGRFFLTLNSRGDEDTIFY